MHLVYFFSVLITENPRCLGCQCSHLGCQCSHRRLAWLWWRQQRMLQFPAPLPSPEWFSWTPPHIRKAVSMGFSSFCLSHRPFHSCSDPLWSHIKSDFPKYKLWGDRDVVRVCQQPSWLTQNTCSEVFGEQILASFPGELTVDFLFTCIRKGSWSNPFPEKVLRRRVEMSLFLQNKWAQTLLA